MPNFFNRVQRLPRVQHSMQNLSHGIKTSIQIGRLVPYLNLGDCLPNSKFSELGHDLYLRLSPMLYPLMHRMKVNTRKFFTPIRIILGEDLYESWLNGKVDFMPMTFIQEAMSKIQYPFQNTIIDYLGVDVDQAVETFNEESGIYTYTLTIENPTSYIAYLMIVRDWYLDSIINATDIDLIDYFLDNYRASFDSGYPVRVDLSAEGSIFTDTFNVAYSKDYFNTARPTPQMGADQFVLNQPLSLIGSKAHSGMQPLYVPAGGAGDQVNVNISGAEASIVRESTTIRDLWRKEAIQLYEQHSGSFGSRVREQLAAHWGVIISDKRLMIPQIVGGSSSYVQISEVIQTSESGDTSALGAFAGKGSAFDSHMDRGYFIEEHGVLLGLVSLVPDNGYVRGQNRFFFKKNIFDFAVPEFNNIGWQEVFNGEIFCQGNDADKQAFGYQPRYSEYRSIPSRCTGQFRHGDLLAWHLDRNFASLPPLNKEFLKVSDTNRIFNIDGLEVGECPIFMDVFNKVSAWLPVSKEPDSFHLY